MALGMKGWLGIVLGSMALVAVTKLPPEPARDPNRNLLPEELRVIELNREIRVAEGILARREVADSLTPLVAGGGVGSVVVDGVVASQPGEEDRGATLREQRIAAARAVAIADLEATGSDQAAVGLFFWLQRGRPFGQETFVGTHEGTPYCYRIIAEVAPPVTVGPHVRTGTGQDALGPCRLIAAHGLPGPRITEWLVDGGVDFAMAPADDLSRWWDHSVETVRNVRGAAASAEPDRCLAGQAAACAETFVHPETINELVADGRRIARATPMLSVGGSMYRSVFGVSDDALLADLEAEFGAERFRAFWTSDQEVRPAFEAAFGTDLGEWVLGWTRDNILGAGASGPRIPPGAIPGGMLIMVLSGLLATFTARRRRLA